MNRRLPLWRYLNPPHRRGMFMRSSLRIMAAPVKPHCSVALEARIETIHGIHFG